ncbi:MAG: hypothetical protein IJH82_02010 [Lachnospiraceae bacterium]|nr:hypothetical protein [Lachnospiraceae bacterium]
MRTFILRNRKRKRNGPDEKSVTLNVKIRPNYGRQKKNIIILGHNSKIRDIMNGFNSFSNEWKTEDGSEILSILVLEEIPPKCSAYDLIRAIYDASPKGNKSVLLGITKPGGVVDLFGRDQRTHMVELGPKDKLIIYSKH